jgi:hypothetical protein
MLDYQMKLKITLLGRSFVKSARADASQEPHLTQDKKVEEGGVQQPFFPSD